jgi:hypothetical protein
MRANDAHLVAFDVVDALGADTHIGGLGDRRAGKSGGDQGG